MKILTANESTQKQGGGWSWLANFRKGMGDLITDDYNEADIYFVPSASMIKPELAEQAKADGKKVVLRTDNALKHSRNGGKGMARMARIAEIADLVVYQCQWAKDYLHDYLGKPNAVIIYNGIDTNIFRPEGSHVVMGNDKPVYLYSSAAKGETKRWEWAWWRYQQYQKENKNAKLLIAGNISTPVMENNFDFFQGERYTFLGMITNPQDMAEVYRGCDYLFAVYENDCYSNTYLEALACGVELIDTHMSGGTPELLKNWQRGAEYNSIERMSLDYKLALARIL